MDDPTAEIERRLDASETLLADLEGRLAQMQSGDLGVSSKSNDLDLVTRADYESERRWVSFIREHFPEDGIVTEEGGASEAEGSREARFRWVVDPIDGTVNYAHGIPFWCVSVGLLSGDERVGGIVSAPALGERFRARRGGGATLNGRACAVNALQPLRAGVVGTGFPYDRDKRAEPIARAAANMLRQAGGLRRLGSAALDACYVAAGRFSGYYEMALKAWDTAASTLIAEEAGARVTDFEGAPHRIFDSSGVVVSNGLVHDELIAAVEPMREAVVMG